MSLLPFVFREMSRPLRMLEHQMRLVDEMFPSMIYPMIRNQRIPMDVSEGSTAETVVQDKEKFQVKLDMQNFTPQEITVKTVNGNSIVIEGRHEEKQDDKGFISRQIVRRFVLPQDHDMKSVVSSISSDGILTITAPRKVDPALQERVVPIAQIGPEKSEKKTES